MQPRKAFIFALAFQFTERCIFSLENKRILVCGIPFFVSVNYDAPLSPAADEIIGFLAIELGKRILKWGFAA